MEQKGNHHASISVSEAKRSVEKRLSRSGGHEAETSSKGDVDKGETRERVPLRGVFLEGRSPSKWFSVYSLSIQRVNRSRLSPRSVLDAVSPVGSVGAGRVPLARSTTGT